MKIKIGVKIIVFLSLFLFFFILLVPFLFDTFVIEKVVESNYTVEESFLDQCVADQDYGYLRQLLNLYDCYDEEKYGKYWELCDGYMDYEEACQYRRSGDEKEKKAYVKKVVRNYNAGNYPENKQKLKEWASYVSKEDF